MIIIIIYIYKMCFKKFIKIRKYRISSCFFFLKHSSNYFNIFLLLTKKAFLKLKKNTLQTLKISFFIKSLTWSSFLSWLVWGWILFLPSPVPKTKRETKHSLYDQNTCLKNPISLHVVTLSVDGPTHNLDLTRLYLTSWKFTFFI